MLLDQLPDCEAIEFDVAKMLGDPDQTIGDVGMAVNRGLDDDRRVVLFTSRSLVSGIDERDHLRIAKLVSDGLVAIVCQLEHRPRYLIVKGGITSHDIATRGLAADAATVVGSLLPGVPVWQLGPATRFPDMHYVIFPGNVGQDDALVKAAMKMT